jgi:molecular chaperone GrpE (heat shock protein)
MNVLGMFDIHRHQPALTRCADTASAPPQAAVELIELSDRLESLAPGDLDQAWIRERLRAILALHEIAPIADMGLVDFTRHEVVADRPADRATQVDHIADTVRPGYLWRGTILRPQQVVAWVEPTP